MLLLVFFVYATRHIKPEHVPERRAKPRTWWGKTRAYITSFGHTAGRLATGPRFLGGDGAVAGRVGMSAVDIRAGRRRRPRLASRTLEASHACSGINVGLIVRATPGNVGFFQFVYALTAGEFGVAAE